MTELNETVGGGAGGTVTVYAHPNATMAKLTARADGREAYVHAGHESLLEITAICASVYSRRLTDEETLAVFSGTPGYGSTADGHLSIMPSGETVLVAVTPEQGAGTVAAELTFEDVAALGIHCAAAAHNR